MIVTAVETVTTCHSCLCWWPCVKIFPESNSHARKSPDTFLTFWNYVQNLCRFDDSYNSRKHMEPATHVMLMTVCENLGWKQPTCLRIGRYIFDLVELCRNSMPVCWTLQRWKQLQLVTHVRLMNCWENLRLIQHTSLGIDAHNFDLVELCPKSMPVCWTLLRWKQLQPVTHVRLMSCSVNLRWKQCTCLRIGRYIFDLLELCPICMPVCWTLQRWKQLQPVIHVRLMTCCENLRWIQHRSLRIDGHKFDLVELCPKSMPICWTVQPKKQLEPVTHVRLMTCCESFR